MNNLLNQLLGNLPQQMSKGVPGNISQFAVGAVSGGLLTALVGQKRVRRFATSAATYGGMALLGGLAYRAYQNWKDNQNPAQAQTASPSDFNSVSAGFLPSSEEHAAKLEFALVKAMIAAAKADGHIDSQEQKRIFSQVEQSNLDESQKATVFDALNREPNPAELASLVSTLEHRSELYLVSYIICRADNPMEKDYLSRLSTELRLPSELVAHLEKQAKEMQELG